MRALLLLALLTACAEDRSFETPEITSQHTLTFEYPDPSPTKVDILFVIDSSPAMAPFQDRVRANITEVATMSMQRLDGDVHVGVITADLGDGTADDLTAMPGSCHGLGDAGALRRSVLVDGAFITDHRTQAGDLVNFRSDFASALENLTDVGAAGCAHTQPLEAIRLALDHNPHSAGFHRRDAKLAIVLLAAHDDESPRTVAEYQQFLRALVTDDDDVMLAVAATDGTTCGSNATDRLRAFAGDNVYSLCSDDLWEFVFRSACVPTAPGEPVTHCIDEPLADLDAAASGLQAGCAVWDDAGAYPQCGRGVLGPCWRLEDAAQQCSFAPNLAFRLDRGTLDAPDPNNIVHVECVAQ